MYSGTTFRDHSGNFIGVHQKIDSAARQVLARHFAKLEKTLDFPTRREILHFEGNNGPDGIKRKSPSVDEPWHFVDPSDPSDDGLYLMIHDHLLNLAEALSSGNRERASFEAAWMAHAVSDGMTPAHHYPLAKKIEELWGVPKDQRDSVFAKNIIRGKGRRDTIAKNWEYWGAKGVFSTHVMFELGIASAIKTHGFKAVCLDAPEIELARSDGYEKWLKAQVQSVYELDMYHEYWRRGWTNNLAVETRRVLMPLIIRAVAMGWLMAMEIASSDEGLISGVHDMEKKS